MSRMKLFPGLPRATALLLALLGMIVTLVVVPAPVAHAFAPNELNAFGRGVATWNSQGARWPQYRNLMNQNRLLAVQEAGADPAGMANMQHVGTITANYRTVEYYHWNAGGGAVYHVYWMSGVDNDAHGGRVNFAFVSATAADQVLVAAPGGATGRAALGLRFQDDVYFNVHLPSGGNNLVPFQQMLNSAYAWGHQNNWGVSVLGDFNLEPTPGVHQIASDAMAGTGRIYRVGDNVMTHDAGHELDYMVSSRIMPNFRGELPPWVINNADHAPVFFRQHLAAAGDVVSLTDQKHDAFMRAESGARGAKITATGTKDTDSRTRWRLLKAGAVEWEFRLQNVDTGLCLDMYNGIYSTPGTVMDQYTCQDNLTTQMFHLYWSTFDPGAWQLRSVWNPSMCLDAMGDNPGYESFWPCDGKNMAINQKFYPVFWNS